MTAARRLVIVRHAKSAWPDGVADRSRPLAGRGRRDAPELGRWLRERIGTPDAVICSPAERTRRTWQLVAAELTDPPEPVFDERVYDAGPGELLAVVRELPAAASTAVLIGHNPGVAALVELLSAEAPLMPTSAVAVLELSRPWRAVGAGSAVLAAHATPRG